MSQYEFKLPDIGEGVTEGEIVGWLVNEGDSVSENQDMVEIMTDKATVTIGAPKSGRIVKLRGKQGDVVPVGEVLVVFDVSGAEGGAESSSDAPIKESRGESRNDSKEAPEEDEDEDGEGEEKSAAKPEEQPAANENRGKRDANGVRGKRSERENEEDASSSEGPAASAVGDIRDALPGTSIRRAQGDSPAKEANKGNGNGYFADKPLAAPATRKLARELGVDLKRVEPSGPGGRVTREDVERFGKRAADEPESTSERAAARDEEPAERAPQPTAKAPSVPAGRDEERVPIRGLRKRIFENMARSKHTAAHFTYVDECDASELKKLRERLAPHAEKVGTKLSFLPFIVKAVVVALKKHPALNCVVDDQSHELVLKKTFDIGIAVATESGLTVAAVRDADRLSIVDTAREVNRLAQAARDNKLRKEELGGTSFTITSLGKLGGLFATPIVNYPEVAILGVHEIKKRPVVKDDQIVVGEVMLLSLSFDHRVIDGHIGAAFAAEIIGLLEDPDRLFAELT